MVSKKFIKVIVEHSTRWREKRRPFRQPISGSPSLLNHDAFLSFFSRRFKLLTVGVAVILNLLKVAQKRQQTRSTTCHHA